MDTVNTKRHEAEVYRVVESIAKNNALIDLKFSNYREDADAATVTIAFRNPAAGARTSHQGDLKVSLKAGQDERDVVKELNKQLAEIPAIIEAAPVPQKGSMDIKDITYVQDGGMVNVQSASLGNITVFSKDDFVEANIEKIKSAIKRNIDLLAEVNNLTIQYAIPPLTELKIVQASVPQTIVSEKEYKIYFEAKENVPEVSNPFFQNAMARLTEKQRSEFQTYLSEIQNQANNEMHKVLSTISSIEGIKILPTNIAPTVATGKDKKLAGTFWVRTRFAHNNDFKTCAFQIKVAGRSMTLPSRSEIIATISSLKGERKQDSEKQQQERIALASSVTPDPAIQKSAALEKAATPTPSAKPFADRVYIMKSNLPASIKKNDVIDVDGIKYRCTCDDGGKLSERGEGDRWLLTMEPDAKEDAVAAPSY